MAQATPQTTDPLNNPSHSDMHRVYDADTGATEPSVRVQSDGVVDMPEQSAARAYLSASAQTISTGTATKVTLDGETYDTRGEFDSTTNYRFTATYAGKYLVTGSIDYNNPADAKLYALYFYVNGTAVSKYSTNASQTGGINITFTDILSLSANDYVEMYTEHNAGVDETIDNDSARTFMAIHKIS